MSLDNFDVSKEEEALMELSDEELEQAFKEAKMEQHTDDIVEDVQDIQEELNKDVTDDDIVDNKPIVDDTSGEELEQPSEEVDVKDSNDGEVPEAKQADEDLDTDQPNVDESVEPEPKAEEVKPEKFTYKANGQSFEFTMDEIKEQFGKVFGQSMNYTQKMQEIAPWKRTISALKDNGYTHDDVNLMIDALKGDKDAVTAIVKKAGVDSVELDTERELDYTPNNYGKSETELALDDVISTISRDEEFKTTQFVVDSQWDNTSRTKLASKPELVGLLHEDIKSGVFDEVSPLMLKKKVLDGGKKSDLEYYIEAGLEYTQNKNLLAEQEELKAKEAQRLAAEEEARKKAIADAKAREQKKIADSATAQKRRAASPTSKAGGRKNVIDYLEDSDEGFEQWYAELQAKM